MIGRDIEIIRGRKKPVFSYENRPADSLPGMMHFMQKTLASLGKAHHYCRCVIWRNFPTLSVKEA